MTLNVDLSTHNCELQNLSREWPNQIGVLDSKIDLSQYTCLMYAFSFTDNPDYIYYAYRNVYAGKEFAEWLLYSGELKEKHQDDANSGDLIFYLDRHQFCHVGIMQSPTTVISKWGIGNLYRHSIWEVPTSYGNLVRIFESIAPKVAWDAFEAYAEINGIQRDESDP